MIREAIATVASGNDLSEADATSVMEEMMTGEATAAQVGALLTALRIKGETVDEITGMVRVMREKSLHVEIDGDVLDVVSTGGGRFDPFNISTCTALVCAGAGVKVAKHGNRGFTSTSGAADVLEALGARIELAPEQAQACINDTDFGFLFAQSFHPAMRFVGPARREIGIRTIFNSLGPLTNPAGAHFQLIGVGDPGLAPKVVEVMARLGTGRTLVVHGDDGLDEVTLSTSTHIWDIRGSEVTAYDLTPEEVGFERVPLESVKTGTAVENADKLRRVLAGEAGPHRDYVLINAGVALMTVGKAENVKDGVAIAAAAIDYGAAAKTLEAYIERTRSFA